MRRGKLIVVLTLSGLVIAACQGTETGTEPPMTTSTTIGVSETTSTGAPTPEPEVTTIPWWGHREVIIDPGDFGLHPEPGDYAVAVHDIKVVQRSDGSYVAIVVSSHTPGSGEPPSPVVHVIESEDLIGWTELARFTHRESLDNGPLIDSLVAAPDGTLHAFAVTDRPGEPIHRSYSIDGGRTWAVEPAPVLTVDDFGLDLRFALISVVELPSGGWRMYVSVNECDRTDAMGGDNCPPGESMGSYEMGVQSVLSAVSDDLATWTVEPGFRFRGSVDHVSIANFHAWVDDDGDIRLIGGLMWTPHSVWREYGRFGSTLGELVSHDGGLTFDPVGYHEYWVSLSDPQIVRAPDGTPRLIGSAPGGSPGDHRTQIIMLAPTTISFWVDEVLARLVAWQGAEEDRPDQPAINCLAVHVHGSGRLAVDARASVWSWVPHSAPDVMVHLDADVIEAPGTVYVARVPSPIPPYEEQWEWFPTYIVFTDERGVEWHALAADYPDENGPPEVAVSDGGDDVASMPCPP